MFGLLLIALFSIFVIAYFNGWLNGKPDFLPESATHVRVFLGGPFGFTGDGFEAVKAKISIAEFEEIVAMFGLVKAKGAGEGFSGFENLINRWWWDPEITAGIYFVNHPDSPRDTDTFAQYYNGNLYFVRSWGF